jgi:multicomponent K+:H+ antiporter subunit E
MSVALFVAWVLLNPHGGAGSLIVAGVVAVGIPLGTSPLRTVPFRIRGARQALALVIAVIGDAVRSNLDVARLVCRRRPPRSAFVRIPLELRNANGLALLALITTLVPGTVWTELAADGSGVLLHVFDVDDEAAFVAHYKGRYERPLIALFG